jgi:hypothetical protein
MENWQISGTKMTRSNWMYRNGEYESQDKNNPEGTWTKNLKNTCERFNAISAWLVTINLSISISTLLRCLYGVMFAQSINFSLHQFVPHPLSLPFGMLQDFVCGRVPNPAEILLTQLSLSIRTQESTQEQINRFLFTLILHILQKTWATYIVIPPFLIWSS